ncbi:MAG: DUF2796 domain-containing protein [Pseudomonadota bacterium]
MASTAAAQNSVHEHGAARLGIATEGDQVFVSFSVDEYTVYGFEGTPSTDLERASQAEGRGKLEDFAALVAIKTSGSCAVLSGGLVEAGLGGLRPLSPLADSVGADEGDDHHDHDGHGDDHDHHGDHHDHDDDDHHAHGDDHGDHDEHGDVSVQFTLKCPGEPKIEQIAVTAFETFPGLEKVTTTLLTQTNQAERVLTSNRSVWRLR